MCLTRSAWRIDRMKRMASRLTWWHMLPNNITLAVNAAEMIGQPLTILPSTSTRRKARSSPIFTRTTLSDIPTSSSRHRVVGRTGPVDVYGPDGIKGMTGHILSAWKEDIRIRTERMEKDFPEHNDTGYKVNVHEIKPGIVYRDKNVTVKAFPVAHGEVPHAFGYRFETPDRTIVISGDTSPSQAVIDNCNGCDVLIHEVYTQKGHAASPLPWQQYRLKYHTSSKQLADLATKARPKLLVLYHQIYYFNASTREDLIREMQEAYQGQFVSGLDLDIY